MSAETEDLGPLQKEIKELEAQLEAQTTLFDELTTKIEEAKKTDAEGSGSTSRAQPTVAVLKEMTNDGLDFSTSVAAAAAAREHASEDPLQPQKLIASGPVFIGTLHPKEFFIDPEIRNHVDGKTETLFARIDKFVANSTVEKLCIVGRQGFGKSTCALAVTKHLHSAHGAAVYPIFVSLPNVNKVCTRPGALDTYVLNMLNLRNAGQFDILKAKRSVIISLDALGECKDTCTADWLLRRNPVTASCRILYWISAPQAARVVDGPTSERIHLHPFSNEHVKEYLEANDSLTVAKKNFIVSSLTGASFESLRRVPYSLSMLCEMDAANQDGITFPQLPFGETMDIAYHAELFVDDAIATFNKENDKNALPWDTAMKNFSELAFRMLKSGAATLRLCEVQVVIPDEAVRRLFLVPQCPEDPNTTCRWKYSILFAYFAAFYLVEHFSAVEQIEQPFSIGRPRVLKCFEHLIEKRERENNGKRINVYTQFEPFFDMLVFDRNDTKKTRIVASNALALLGAVKPRKLDVNLAFATIEDCNLDGVHFGTSNIKGTTFVNCSLQHTIMFDAISERMAKGSEPPPNFISCPVLPPTKRFDSFGGYKPTGGSVSLDGEWIIVWSGKTCTLYNALTYTENNEIKLKDPITDACFTADGTRCFVASGKMMLVWGFQSDIPELGNTTLDNKIVALCPLPGTRNIIIADNVGNLVLFDHEKLEVVDSFTAPAKLCECGLTPFANEAENLLGFAARCTADDSTSVQIWHGWKTSPADVVISPENGVRSCTVSPNGKLVAINEKGERRVAWYSTNTGDMVGATGDSGSQWNQRQGFLSDWVVGIGFADNDTIVYAAHAMSIGLDMPPVSMSSIDINTKGRKTWGATHGTKSTFSEQYRVVASTRANCFFWFGSGSQGYGQTLGSISAKKKMSTVYEPLASILKKAREKAVLVDRYAYVVDESAPGYIKTNKKVEIYGTDIPKKVTICGQKDHPFSVGRISVSQTGTCHLCGEDILHDRIYQCVECRMDLCEKCGPPEERHLFAREGTTWKKADLVEANVPGTIRIRLEKASKYTVLSGKQIPYNIRVSENPDHVLQLGETPCSATKQCFLCKSSIASQTPLFQCLHAARDFCETCCPTATQCVIIKDRLHTIAAASPGILVSVPTGAYNGSKDEVTTKGKDITNVTVCGVKGHTPTTGTAPCSAKSICHLCHLCHLPIIHETILQCTECKVDLCDRCSGIEKKVLLASGVDKWSASVVVDAVPGKVTVGKSTVIEGKMIPLNIRLSENKDDALTVGSTPLSRAKVCRLCSSPITHKSILQCKASNMDLCDLCGPTNPDLVKNVFVLKSKAWCPAVVMQASSGTVQLATPGALTEKSFTTLSGLNIVKECRPVPKEGVELVVGNTPVSKDEKCHLCSAQISHDKIHQSAECKVDLCDLCSGIEKKVLLASTGNKWNAGVLVAAEPGKASVKVGKSTTVIEGKMIPLNIRLSENKDDALTVGSTPLSRAKVCRLCSSPITHKSILQCKASNMDLCAKCGPSSATKMVLFLQNQKDWVPGLPINTVPGSMSVIDQGVFDLNKAQKFDNGISILANIKPCDHELTKSSAPVSGSKQCHFCDAPVGKVKMFQCKTCKIDLCPACAKEPTFELTEQGTTLLEKNFGIPPTAPEGAVIMDCSKPVRHAGGLKPAADLTWYKGSGGNVEYQVYCPAPGKYQCWILMCMTEVRPLQMKVCTTNGEEVFPGAAANKSGGKKAEDMQWFIQPFDVELTEGTMEVHLIAEPKKEFPYLQSIMFIPADKAPDIAVRPPVLPPAECGHGAETIASVAVSSFAPVGGEAGTHVVHRNKDGNLEHTVVLDAKVVAPTTTIDCKGATSSPSLFAQTKDVLELAVLGPKSTMVVNTFTKGSWGTFSEANTTKLTSAPSLCQVPFADGMTLVAFAKSGANTLVMSKRVNGKWQDWDDLGGGDFDSAPAACYRGPSDDPSTTVLIRQKKSGRFQQKVFDGGEWTTWSEFDTQAQNSSPSLVSACDGHMLMVSRMPNNSAAYKTFTNGKWSGYSNLKGTHRSAPSLAACGDGKNAANVELTCAGDDKTEDKTIWRCVFGKSWGKWGKVGGVGKAQ